MRNSPLPDYYVVPNIDRTEYRNGNLYIYGEIANVSMYNLSCDVWVKVEKIGNPYDTATFSYESKAVNYRIPPFGRKPINIMVPHIPAGEYAITLYADNGLNVFKAGDTLTIFRERCPDSEFMTGEKVTEDVTHVVSLFEEIKRATLTIYWKGGKFYGTMPPNLSEKEEYDLWKSGWAYAFKKCEKDNSNYYYKLPAKLTIEYNNTPSDDIKYKRYDSPVKKNTSNETSNSSQSINKSNISSLNSAGLLGLGIGIVFIGVILFLMRR